MGVEFVNLSEVLNDFIKEERMVEFAMIEGLRVVAVAVQAQTKRNLESYQNSANNRSDYRGHEGPYPGFPDQVTGNLKTSVRLSTYRLGLSVYVAEVYSDAVYARKVELGGNGSRPFAYLEPAVRTVDPNRLFKTVFASRLKG